MTSVSSSVTVDNSNSTTMDHRICILEIPLQLGVIKLSIVGLLFESEELRIGVMVLTLERDGPQIQLLVPK